MFFISLETTTSGGLPLLRVLFDIVESQKYRIHVGVAERVAECIHTLSRESSNCVPMISQGAIDIGVLLMVDPEMVGGSLAVGTVIGVRITEKGIPQHTY